MGPPIKDADLLELVGSALESPELSGVSYLLERVIGEGAHGIVFLATQRRADVESRVVVKLLRPRAVREVAGLAAAAIRKEVAALQRLSGSRAPSPFVVRFLDSGTLRIRDHALELPWLVVEHVDGGPEGTTLHARVAASMAQHGKAFDLARARNAIQCIASGIAAIHEVGVVHRDVNPRNILCTGAEATEVYKIADFGLARVSSATTFGNVLLGTPGYCAPEQSFPDNIGVGPYTDVFSLACCTYFILTGEAYFTAPSIPEMLVAVYGSERRSLRDAKGLCDELRANAEACAQLDAVLACATAADPRGRQQTARGLAQVILDTALERQALTPAAP